MAITRGRVVDMTWQSEAVCVYVGTSATSAELFTVEFRPSDPPFVIEHKRLMVKLLTTALTSRRDVEITHATQDPIVDGVGFPMANISPVGPAIHNDFYSIAVAGIPDGVDPLVAFFSTDLTRHGVSVNLRFAEWVLIDKLEPSLATGPCFVSLWGPTPGNYLGWESDRVPVTVSDGPPLTVRTLYSGRPTTEPYTFVFAAPPAISVEQILGPSGESLPGYITPDPVLTNRPAFHDAVHAFLVELFMGVESLLRADNLQAQIRFVTIFDPTQGPTAANAIVTALSPNIIRPLRERLNGFVGRYWENPDIVFCLTGSTVYGRPSAWFTTDDHARAGVAFTYDGVVRTHGRYTDIPGSAALPTYITEAGPLPSGLHEFCHAASEWDNGEVVDLYHDGVPEGYWSGDVFKNVFVVNKKKRTRATDPVPINFATYAGKTYRSDPDRGGAGYPSDWKSYHPQGKTALTRPISGTPEVRRNLMDYVAPESALDHLTFAWLRDRLRAKVFR
jgi:hypothetical protein